MEDELNALLNAAKTNLKQKKSTKESPEDIVKSIPKLKDVSLASTTTLPKQTTKIKAVPTNLKPQKPDNAGKAWFDLGRPVMTDEIKRDLQLLKMRHVLDPKRFYKKADEVSKYFAVGTIQNDPTEFYSNRLTKKQRKQTLAEEVLSTRRDYFKGKYSEIQKKKMSGRRKFQKKRRDMRS